MSDHGGDVWDELSFLATPDHVADWRMALLFEAADEAGLLDDLPASAGELAERRGLDLHAVRVVLEALAAWGVVAADGTSFSSGWRRPNREQAAVLRHHARAIRLWGERVADQLRGGGKAAHPWGLELWLEGLAANARQSAPAAVEECLRRAPRARSVLDLGGGHGEYAPEFARRGVEVTMQDRGEVVALARGSGRLEEAGVRLCSGDFFSTLAPGPFDVVFCAGVTYTYDGGRNRELFRRASAVIAPGGVLVVHTFPRGRDARAAIFAVHMLRVSAGDTHGEEEYRQWLASAGYRSVHVVHLPRLPESLLLATP